MQEGSQWNNGLRWVSIQKAVFTVHWAKQAIILVSRLGITIGWTWLCWCTCCISFFVLLLVLTAVLYKKLIRILLILYFYLPCPWYYLPIVLYCCNQRAWSTRAQSLTLAASNNRNHSYCLFMPHTYRLFFVIFPFMVLHVHMQCCADGAAVTFPPSYNELHQFQILFVKAASGIAFTSWSQHNFICDHSIDNT